MKIFFLLIFILLSCSKEKVEKINADTKSNAKIKIEKDKKAIKIAKYKSFPKISQVQSILDSAHIELTKRMCKNGGFVMTCFPNIELKSATEEMKKLIKECATRELGIQWSQIKNEKVYCDTLEECIDKEKKLTVLLERNLAVCAADRFEMQNSDYIDNKACYKFYKKRGAKASFLKRFQEISRKKKKL